MPRIMKCGSKKLELGSKIKLGLCVGAPLSKERNAEVRKKLAGLIRLTCPSPTLSGQCQSPPTQCDRALSRQGSHPKISSSTAHGDRLITLSSHQLVVQMHALSLHRHSAESPIAWTTRVPQLRGTRLVWVDQIAQSQ